MSHQEGKNGKANALMNGALAFCFLSSTTVPQELICGTQRSP